jgi:hypothetical protein
VHRDRVERDPTLVGHAQEAASTSSDSTSVRTIASSVACSERLSVKEREMS